jgi:hypothetical protein
MTSRSIAFNALLPYRSVMLRPLLEIIVPELNSGARKKRKPDLEYFEVAPLKVICPLELVPPKVCLLILRKRT